MKDEEEVGVAKLVGENLQRIRKAAGVTQTELGHALDLGPSTISLIESGKRDPGVTKIAAICQALGCNPDDLFVANPASHPLPLVPVLKDVHDKPILLTPPLNAKATGKMVRIPDAIFERHPHSYLIQVGDGSMGSIWSEGDLVLIDPDMSLSAGDVSLVSWDGRPACLRRVIGSHGGGLSFRSEPSAGHEGKTCPINGEVSDCGRAIWDIPSSECSY